MQVLLQSTPTHSGAMYTSAVAAGGRYDALLRSLWSPAAATLMPAPGAVGVSINCEKIVKMLLQKRRHKAGVAHGHGSAAAGFAGLGLEGGGRLPAGQCDVLVCARGEDGMLQVRAGCGYFG
jgi:histidyl-tRNA synthetase